MTKLLYLLSSIILFADTIHAVDNKVYLNKLNTCHPTRSVINNYEPKIFQPTNNLLRSPGAMPVVCGQRLVIKGRLLDNKCVPISDAKVYIWQVGCNSKYPYEPLRTKAIGKHIDTSQNSSFVGNGIATTDNNGEFEFITIYPAKSETGKHTINLRAEHRDIGLIQTQITPHSKNDSYEFTIVMHEQNLYRRY